MFAPFAFVCRTSKLVLARVKTSFSLYCSALQLKTKLVRNDNMDYSLLNKGFNVWEPAWTKQEAYLKNKSTWKHLKGVQK